MLLLQDIDERALHAETKMRAAYYLGNTKALEKKYPAAHSEPRKRLFKSYVVPAISNSTYTPEGISEVMCHSINCVDDKGQPFDKVCATSIEQMFPSMKEGEVFNRRPEDLEFHVRNQTETLNTFTKNSLQHSLMKKVKRFVHKKMAYKRKNQLMVMSL